MSWTATRRQMFSWLCPWLQYDPRCADTLPPHLTSLTHCALLEHQSSNVYRIHISNSFKRSTKVIIYVCVGYSVSIKQNEQNTHRLQQCAALRENRAQGSKGQTIICPLNCIALNLIRRYFWGTNANRGKLKMGTDIDKVGSGFGYIR